MQEIPFEKYRPKEFSEVLGQDKAISTIQKRIRRSGWAGQRWYLTGATGTGKTTLARIIARMEATACQIVEVNAIRVNLEFVRDIENQIAYPSMFGGRAWIINEAHLLSSKVVSAFLDCLEKIAEKQQDCIIFTTTWAGSESLFADSFDSKPFSGRCNQVSLTNQGFNQCIVNRLQEISRLENIKFDGDFMTEKLAKSIVKKVGSTMREAIIEMENLEDDIVEQNLAIVA